MTTNYKSHLFRVKATRASITKTKGTLQNNIIYRDRNEEVSHILIIRQYSSHVFIFSYHDEK